MRRGILVILVSLVALVSLGQGDDFADAKWIGHMTRELARLPEGRNFTGAKLKEPDVKAAWAAVDTMSGKSICLRRDIRQ